MSYKVEKNKPRECDKCKYTVSDDRYSKCPKCGNDIGVILDPYDVFKNGRCGGCNWPMYGSEITLKILLKKATWENPVSLAPNLKEGIENIPRALGLLCKNCVEKNIMPKMAIYFEKGKLRYIPVENLEDVFEITQDMIKQ